VVPACFRCMSGSDRPSNKGESEWFDKKWGGGLTYSGSTYPCVPTRVFVDTCVPFSRLKALVKPKSAILASNLEFSRMLAPFTSL
jgi:hypothetical protein